MQVVEELICLEGKFEADIVISIERERLHMITVENLSFGFPQKELYEDITFNIERGQHAAFIGSSGSGKSTLIDMIIHSDRYMYDGKLEIETTRKIGYISQFVQFDKEDLTVFEFVSKEFHQVETNLQAIYKEMEDPDDLDEVMKRYQELVDYSDAIQMDTYEARIKSQLNMAGMGEKLDQMVSKLSGGELKLIQVIREMLTNPELLIMDEPDVFLDFSNLNALKELINTHKGTLLIITHSRYLLDHCFDKIVHIENKEVQEFDGTYQEYQVSLLEQKIEQQELALADEEEIERNEKLIERLREKATYNAEAANGRSLKARVKIQERLVARRVKQPFVDIKQPNISFSTNKVITEQPIMEVKDYRLAFDRLLLEHINFAIEGKEKVALIGPNGTGKTTLFRDIVRGVEDSITIHEDAEVAYLSQVQNEVLHEQETVLNEFLNLGIETNTKVKEYICSFGFDEEILQQQIKDLSGGEKNMLQLAKISLGNANLLLLDEPTSHLDTYAQLALEAAIINYNGAVLMVSHDFYSIINCMDYVLYIEDNTIRKMSMRKFRQTIYKAYFDRDYLLFEQKKKEIEVQIAKLLEKKDFEQANILLEKLKEEMQTME